MEVPFAPISKFKDCEKSTQSSPPSLSRKWDHLENDSLD